MWWSKSKAKEDEKEKLGKQVVVMDCVYHCLKENCPQWVILFNQMEKNGKIEPVPEGKCAIAWIPTILTEINNNIKGLAPKGTEIK